MSGVATAIVGGAVIAGGASYLSSKSASKSAEDAAGVSAGAQTEALNYIKETEEVPQELRRGALEKLGGIYGLSGGSGGNVDPSTPVNDLQGNPTTVQALQNRIYDLQGKITKNRGFSNQGHAARNIGEAQAEINKIQDLISNAGGGGGGGEGDTSGQQDLIDQAKNSPLYAAMMGTQEGGEEAIMRNASATGGLRSGNVQGNMYDYVTQLQNKALLSSYNEQLSGLQGLAGLPSNSSEIAGMMSGIGNTQAQGMTASAAMKAQGMQSGINNAMGLAGLGIQAYSSGMFSDRRLKKNVVHIGNVNGHKFYKFDWNKLANELGLYGSTCGCMADEVYSKVPEAVLIKNDFLFVNYSTIGVL